MTFYVGEKGDEVADYTHNFKLGTTTIKTTSFYLYTGKRAGDATPEEAMTTSETYKGELSSVDSTKLMSRTFYTGEKGDEVADYTHNFKLGTTTIKTTSFYLYTGKRASDATPEEAMTTSETYKGELSAIDATKLMRRTFYVGEKGDEVADYTHNFKLGTATIKTTSFYLYTGKRAGDATPEEAMTTRETYKGDLSTIDATKLMTRTFYVGRKE